VRGHLAKKGALAVQEVDYMGRPQKRTVALREPDLSAFTGAEIATVDEVIAAFWDADATSASAFSHRFMGWKIAEDQEEIPYESVFVADRPLTQAEKDYALELVS
jgi:hypothetical protein